jgi:putative membrane protein
MMTMPEIHWVQMLAALIYAAIGLGIFAVAFVVVDRFTPYSLWRELIDEHNTALAIVVGAVALGIALIVSAAIR